MRAKKWPKHEQLVLRTSELNFKYTRRRTFFFFSFFFSFVFAFAFDRARVLSASSLLFSSLHFTSLLFSLARLVGGILARIRIPAFLLRSALKDLADEREREKEADR